MHYLGRTPLSLLLALGLIASLSAPSILATNTSVGLSQFSAPAIAYAYIEVYENYVVKVFPPDSFLIW